MSEVYKKSGEKIKLGNRNACIYTKEKGKTKYIKSNKEMVLLSKEFRRLKINTKKQVGGTEPTIKDYYEPVYYTEDPKSVKYINNIKIVENSEKNPPKSAKFFDGINAYITRKTYKNLQQIYYCSKIATHDFVKKYLTGTLKFKNSDVKVPVIKWTIPYVENLKVLVIGDIHGDVIALEKVFKKWIEKGYLEQAANSKEIEPIYTLKENTYVLSTGDLIDYGSKSVNILCAMLRLRKDNPGKVMLLCGNHETNSEGISGRTDLDDEIKKTYTSTEINKIISEAITNIGLIGPDMVALHIGDEKEGTYFMHGMYPIKYKYKRQFTTPPSMIYNDNEYGEFLNEYDQRNLNTDSIEHTLVFDGPHKIWPRDFNEFQNIQNLLSELIQWNDVTTSKDGAALPSGRNLRYCGAIGTKHITEVMNIYGIKGFIRGHQDKCGAHGYPMTTECKDNLNINPTIDNETLDHFNTTRACKTENTSTDDGSGWCIREGISYSWKPIVNDKDLLHRVITISMANQKNNIAPLGGYIELTFTPLEAPVKSPRFF